MMFRRSPLTTRDISRHRPIIYGIAALMVMYHHMDHTRPAGMLSAPLRWLHMNGAAGVDIFVLLSGFGLYHSLSRSSVRSFYAKRMLRIIPATYIITLIMFFLHRHSIKWLTDSLTFVPFWFGGNGFWYVSFILTMYLAYPLIFRIQKRAPHSLWALTAAALLYVALRYYIAPESGGQHLGLALLRIPTFLLGCIIAPYFERETVIPRLLAPAALVLYIILACNYYILGNADWLLHTLSYIPLSVFAVILFTRLAQLLSGSGVRKLIYRFLALCGSVSLELYLLYSRTLSPLNSLLKSIGHPVSRLNLELLGALLTLISAVAISRFCGIFSGKFRRGPAA